MIYRNTKALAAALVIGLLVTSCSIADRGPSIIDNSSDININPIAGYSIESGGEIFNDIISISAIRNEDEIDIGSINIYQINSDISIETKNYIIDRYTINNSGIHGDHTEEIIINGITWYRIHHHPIDEYYRYDSITNSIIQYQQDINSISDEDAIKFIEIFDQSQ
jgi:hypothetical protein